MIHIQPKRPRRPWWIIICLGFLLVIFVLACADESRPLPGTAKPAHKFIHQGRYAIPVFKSPRAQLNYALSRFSDSLERAAALKVVMKRFPTARMEVAEANLELAYLSLGEDFRITDRPACRRALVKYERIIKRFHDLRPICAKARWYIAWIYMDLLKDKARGIKNYWKVVSIYPDEGFLPAPRLHWQEIFARAARKETAFLSTKERWAALALLEIARHSDHPDERIGAVKRLMESYPSSRASGHGVLALLRSPPVTDRVIRLARDYLQSEYVYTPIASHIRKKLQVAAGHEASGP